MSRSGYTDDIEDYWAYICWRGAVNSSIRGKRGQAFLKELLEALDAMPKKRLIAEELQDVTGNYCALGVLGSKRGLDIANIDPYDSQQVAKTFGIANALAREIVFINDEGCYCSKETPEKRWARVREWVAENIESEK